MAKKLCGTFGTSMEFMQSLVDAGIIPQHFPLTKVVITAEMGERVIVEYTCIGDDDTLAVVRGELVKMGELRQAKNIMEAGKDTEQPR